MKKLILLIVLFTVTIITNGFFCSCSTVKQEHQSNQEKPVLIKLLPGGRAQFVKSEALIKRAMENYFNDGTVIRTIEIKIDTGKTTNRQPVYYILGTGSLDSNSRAIAMHLEKRLPTSDGTIVMAMTGSTDVCAGDPCSKCTFIAGGCICSGFGKDGKAGFCNHTHTEISWNTSPLQDTGEMGK